jgi:hypothetical protein
MNLRQLEKKIIYLYQRIADIDDEILALLKQVLNTENALSVLQNRASLQNPQLRMNLMVSHIHLSVLKVMLRERVFLSKKHTQKTD